MRFPKPLSAPAREKRRADNRPIIAIAPNPVRRPLVFDYATDPDSATPRKRHEAVARYRRDVLALRCLKTRKTRDRVDPKRL